MQRLRELLAHGSIAILAMVFALGFAAYGLASAVAREVVSIVQQKTVNDDGSGGSASRSSTRRSRTSKCCITRWPPP